MIKKTFRLEDIEGNYKYTLIDTCSIISYLGSPWNKKSLHKTSLSLDDRTNSVSTILNNLKNDSSIHVTPGIFYEFSTFFDEHYSYKNSIKRIDYCFNKQVFGKEKRRQLLDVNRKINQYKKIMSKIYNLFQENDAILSLSEEEKEFYNSLRKNNLNLKSKYSLSESNFDLLLNSIVVGKKRSRTALISNDFGILFAWKNFTTFHSGQNLDFFLRNSMNKFRQAE